MTQLVEKIFLLAKKATRAEQYAAVSAILVLLEEQDADLSPKQIAKLDRRDALLREGKMPLYTIDEVMKRIQNKLDKASS